MDPIRGVLQALSLGYLTDARAVRPVQPVLANGAGDIMLQPDSYEPGSPEAPMPAVSYTARGVSR